MTPTASVIIATKDRAADLARALASLEAQEGIRPFEVVVVDNGSSDATPQVVADAIARGVIAVQSLFEPQPNRGAARNRGIAAARSPLVIFVDDDVWLPVRFVSAHLEAHYEMFSCVVNGPIINVPHPDARPCVTFAHYSGAFFCTCNVSVPKAALEAVGGFDESFDLYGWEDTELGMRLRERGYPRAFAWDAYHYHIKPPQADTLERAMRRNLEKARMAARFVRKFPTARARLATGAYRFNLGRARAMTPRWSLPLWAAAATSLPAPLGSLARSRLLDGVYVDELARSLRDGD